MAENVEKREYVRVDKDLEVMISMASTGEYEKEYSFLKGRSVNISEGGLMLTYGEVIEVDTEIELTLFLPHSNDLITLYGLVKRVDPWRDKYKIAVEFIRYIKDAKERLKELIDELIKE